jgi:hypothetical protein
MRDTLPVPTEKRDRELIRGLVARIDLDAHVASVEQAVAQMPEYRSFVEDGRGALDRDRGRIAIRWNLETCLRWLAEGQEPTEDDLSRLREMISVRVAEGRPLDEGLAVYRRGIRMGWDTLQANASPEERVALAGVVDIFLSWIDLVSETFTQAYAQHRDALISQQERRARLLIERLASDISLGSEVLSLAETLGFRVAERYVPFVVSLPDGSMAQHTDLAARLRRTGPLAATEGRRVVGLAHGEVKWEGLGFGKRIVIAAGGPTEPASLTEALDDLRAVVSIAERAGQRGRLDVSRYLPELLLQRSPGVAQQLDEQVFGPLLAADRPELVNTLEVLVAQDFERAATARALPVHRNTLTQRIARIQELTQLDPEKTEDRGVLWLATLARRAGHSQPTDAG